MMSSNGASAGTLRANTSTPQVLKRLASDHNFVLEASPPPRRRGWWAFVGDHPSLPAALCAGIVFNLAAILYTGLLSRQVLDCPSWATNCNAADRWTVDNLGTVQGIIAFIYIIGLAALAYVVHGLCEAGVWPLLSRQRFTVRQMEAYLATSRGSIMSVPAALSAIKSAATGLLLASAVVATLIPFIGVPLVGHAFTPQMRDVSLQSRYQPGGGISELYAQTDPPTSVMAGVLGFYETWASSNPSSEPLPQSRDWYVDRVALQPRGNFTARAVRLQQSVTCAPYQVRQVVRAGVAWNAFATNMTQQAQQANATAGPRNSSAEAWVRPYPQLTLWADNFSFVSANRTRATLVFAALNGTIDGGATTPLSMGNIATASAIACDVDVEAVDDILTVANNPSPPQANTDAQLPVLSSIADMNVNPASGPQAINEMLLWFTVAPAMAGVSVDGTQPMFYNSSATGLPLPYTASASVANNSAWTTAGIEQFIHVAIGALAQATASNNSTNGQPPQSAKAAAPIAPVTLTSAFAAEKIATPRAVLLILLPLILLALMTYLAVWNAAVHRRHKIPVMRLAGAGELLKSAQTHWLRENAATDSAKVYLPSELGGLEVQYGIDSDGIVGLGSGVKRF